jgi:hypothetical protein
MSWIPMAIQAGTSIYNALNQPDDTPQKLDTILVKYANQKDIINII